VPPLTEHQASKITKLIILGDSTSGKTGSLASLACAGYNLRIIDLDNNADVLYDYLTSPKSPYPPGHAQNVRIITLTDPLKNISGKIYFAKSVVWPKVMSLLDNWTDGEEKLGPVTNWGEKDILVIDSLSKLAEAALTFHLAMNNKLFATPNGNEARRDIGIAQSMIDKFLSWLKYDGIKCNIIVICHIKYVNERGTTPDDITGERPQKGWPNALGAALSPLIPRHFPTMLLYEKQTFGNTTKRMIYTQPRGVTDAKTSAPTKVLPAYPIESGLADYFAALRS